MDQFYINNNETEYFHLCHRFWQLSVISLFHIWWIYINKMVSFPWIIFIFTNTTLKEMATIIFVSFSLNTDNNFLALLMWDLVQCSVEALGVFIDLRAVLLWFCVDDISFSCRFSGFKINYICSTCFLSLLKMVVRNNYNYCIITIGKGFAR